MARVGIIGGGIIGTTAAARLLSEGHEVTVFESDMEGVPASAGNAGLLALTEIEPLASLATLRAVPAWLLDPHGPLAIRLPCRPSLLGWLARFALNTRPGQLSRGRKALTGLLASALEDHEDLGRRTGLTGHLRETGALYVFDTRQGLDGFCAESRHVEANLGIAAEILSPEEARQRVPALEGPFMGAAFMPAYRTVTHPARVLAHYRETVAARGTLVASRVTGIRAGEDQVALQGADGTWHTFDHAVIAAGIWSRELVVATGLKVSLETERGYNTTFENPDIDLKVPLFFTEQGAVVSPLENALRVGGAVELASPDASPSRSRARALLHKVRRYLPSLPEIGGMEWMGRRPSTPDSIPVIGRDPRHPRLIHAFGHGHLGLTLSATTARHVAALVAGGGDEAVLAPCSIARFH